MQFEKLPPPAWIASPAALEKLAGELRRWPRIAVDTESNSLYAFQEQLCLIQVSTPQADSLVDPLALTDLSTLGAIFADPQIEKVFHAVEYDQICLKRDYGITITNLFDTMQAARILGYAKVGLDSVLEGQMGIKVNKKYQKADWGERPLSPEMLNYARLDTHYLLELRERLGAQLQRRGRWDLAQEEFARLAEGNGNDKVEIPPWQRVKGVQKFSNRQLTILQELCAWRDRQARNMDRPPFKVIDDKRLIGVAQALPDTLNDLAAIGLTGRQVTYFGNELLIAVKRGRQIPMVSRPHTPRPSQAYLNRLNLLSDWRKTVGQKLKVDSDIILPKIWMHSIAEKNTRNLDELAALMPNSTWRLGQFGGEILKVLARKHKTEPVAKKE
jgi:ribonuclease D